MGCFASVLSVGHHPFLGAREFNLITNGLHFKAKLLPGLVYNPIVLVLLQYNKCAVRKKSAIVLLRCRIRGLFLHSLPRILI